MERCRPQLRTGRRLPGPLSATQVAGLQLNAYEQQVRALVEGRQLTEIQGAKLLAGATLIRRMMEEERTR